MSATPPPGPPSEVDVAIVGGGIAGLVAATRLRERGLDCHVLERAERVGGRLRTLPTAAGPVDLGATWFWPGEHRVAALIDQLQVPTHAHHLDGDAMYHVPGGARRIEGNPIDVPAGRFSHGAASLAEGLADRLGPVVSLGIAVHGIDQRAGHPVVEHASGSLAARHVVLALPPAVAVQAIDFRPALPDDLRALAATTPVWMGAMAKVVITYPEAFWRRTGLAGAAISHIGPLREVHDMSGADGDPAALFGFAPLGPTDPAPTAQAVVAQLVEIFGHEAAAPLQVIVHDWREDHHPVRSDTTTGQPWETYGHAAYQRPTGAGRIHWASTETAPDAPGHIEGAIAAAERAVDAITSD